MKFLFIFILFLLLRRGVCSIYVLLYYLALSFLQDCLKKYIYIWLTFRSVVCVLMKERPNYPLCVCFVHHHTLDSTPKIKTCSCGKHLRIPRTPGRHGVSNLHENCLCPDTCHVPVPRGTDTTPRWQQAHRGRCQELKGLFTTMPYQRWTTHRHIRAFGLDFLVTSISFTREASFGINVVWAFY